MLGQQFATILARTDPFDVAQGLERHIRALTGAEIRALIQAAQPRMNDWYRTEFLPLLDEPDDNRLRAAFAHSLKSNLRAIPLFGPNFCEGVIANIPADRTVGLGEEGHRRLQVRFALVAVIALALLMGAAVVQHVFSAVRANADTPVVLVTPEPVATAAAPAPVPAKPVTPASHVMKPKPAPATAPPPVHVAAAAVATPAPAVEQPAPAPVVPVHAPAVRRTPPPGRGSATVVARQPQPTPTPEPTPVDVSDMPQSYTDATPLPANATAPPAEVNTSVRVPTPTPAPNRSWTHRLVHAAVHLVNSTLTTVGVAKKSSEPTPSASPSGPQQR